MFFHIWQNRNINSAFAFSHFNKGLQYDSFINENSDQYVHSYISFTTWTWDLWDRFLIKTKWWNDKISILSFHLVQRQCCTVYFFPGVMPQRSMLGHQSPAQSEESRERKTSALHLNELLSPWKSSQLCRFGVMSLMQTGCLERKKNKWCVNIRSLIYKVLTVTS